MDEDGLISRDQFMILEERHASRLAERLELDKGTDGHKQLVVRRWAVRLWNFQLESQVVDEAMVFMNINWGGDRQEARIRTGEGGRWWQFFNDPEVVWGTGSEPRSFRSDVEHLKEKGTILFKNELKFEWKGSYDELETQQMSVEVWRWNKFRANTLDSVHRASLVSYATGPVLQEISLVKASMMKSEGFVISDNKSDLPRFRLTFQVYFQEIYDFELHVIDVQALGLMEVTKKNSTENALHQNKKNTESIFDDSDVMSEEEEDEVDEAATDKKKNHNRLSKRTKRRVQIEVRNPSMMHRLRRGEMSIKSAFRRVDRGDRWGDVGRIYYRGTLADLDNDSLRVKFYESSFMSPVPRLVGDASVSLRGVYEFGSLAGTCGGGGSFEAKITVENMPKYRQSGELCDMILSEKAYLLVHVLRVDRVAVPDQRPLNQCDTAVQVQFGGNSYETEVQQDSISPQFNQEFYFELKTNSPSDFSPDQLAAMHGPILLDVWLRSDDEGALTAEHCGHVEISLLEIFSQGKPEIKTHTSIRTGSVDEYETVVLKARRRLTCLWTIDVASSRPVNVPASAALPSHLYVDVWLRPFNFSASLSLVKNNVIVSTEEDLLPGPVRAEWTSRSKEWQSRARNLDEKYWAVQNRFFNFSAVSQNRNEHFLPLFLDVLRPPQLIANPKAIAFWIHCLPNTSMDELKAAQRYLFSPDFTLSLGKGDTFAHAILHCSMLRGLSTRAFVCIGTGWNAEPLAWVMTLDIGGENVFFFDTAGHRKFQLSRRFADVARAKRVALDQRQAGQVISEEMVQLELGRRRRLAQQEAYVQKLAHSVIDCDPDILRAPELLKVLDPEFHPHALVYCSSIDPHAICYRCGNNAEKRKLHGYICNRKLAVVTTTDAGSCAVDDGMFLCLSCGERSLSSQDLLPEKDFSPPAMKFSEMPVLPYKSIDVVFDQTNCWLNLQHFCPCAIFYDFWNPLYWHPFTTVLTSFRSFSQGYKGFRKARPREYFDKIRLKILTKLRKSIDSLRRNANLSTFFQQDELLIMHMERGLELCFKRELYSEAAEDGVEKLKLESEWTVWKLQLYSKIPPSHRFEGHSFLFSFADASEISRIILDRIPFLSYKETGSQFVVSTFTGKLPNSLKAVYVYVGIVFPLSDTAVLETTASRTQDSFETSRTMSAFTDEEVERNRRFIQRMQSFENETQFLTKMKAQLYNSGDSNNATSSIKPNTRAPVSSHNLVSNSSVDFPSQPLEETAGPTGAASPNSIPFSNPFAWIPQMPNLPELPSALPEPPVPQLSSGGGFFSSLFGTKSPEHPVEAVGSIVASQTTDHPTISSQAIERSSGSFPAPPRPRAPLYNPPKDLTKKGPVVTPLSLASPVNPTQDELREIYKPFTVEKVVGHRQYIRHLPSGYAIPIPPQEPLQRAAELGGEDLVTRVRVKSAHISTVVKKVNPPKEAVYDFNMNAYKPNN